MRCCSSTASEVSPSVVSIDWLPSLGTCLTTEPCLNCPCPCFGIDCFGRHPERSEGSLYSVFASACSWSLPLPVLKSVSSVQIGVKPWLFKQNSVLRRLRPFSPFNLQQQLLRRTKSRRS